MGESRDFSEAKAFARLLRNYRLGCKPPLTQSELANRLNVSQQTVSNWERGEFVPRPSMRRKLANLLGIPLSQVFRPGAEGRRAFS